MTTHNDGTDQTRKPVWFITGCSTGFGRTLAEAVLKRGYAVAVTARRPESVQDLAGLGSALILRLDVTDPAQISAAVHAAEQTFGGIDVLVNNAGIGYFAAVEEGEDTEIHKMFDLNLFGLAHVINAALPGMRKAGRGFIVNVSSIAGLRSFPAVGWYNASKFAVEGLSGALRLEVAPLGIKVMLVEPSGFRTDWAGRSANESKTVIADYAATAGEARHHLREISGKQRGNPALAIEAIITAVESKTPPAHLLLGNDAYDGAIANLRDKEKEFGAWESISRGADDPKTVKPEAV